MYYELHGEGDIKLMLVMGFATSCKAWEGTIEYFISQGNTQVLVMDNRGYCRSEIPTGRFTTREMAKDLVELIHHVGWEHCHVVGISMGGMITLELSLMIPAKILSLSLAVTHAGHWPASIPPFSGLVLLGKQMAASSVDERAHGISHLIYSQKFLNTKIDDKTTMYDRVKQNLIRRITSEPKTDLKGVIGQMGAVSTHYVSIDNLKKLQQSGIPIVIMTGTDDNLVKPSNSHSLKEYLKPAEFLVFEGAGHAVNVECFDEFNACILRNMKRAIIDTSSSPPTITTDNVAN